MKRRDISKRAIYLGILVGDLVRQDDLQEVEFVLFFRFTSVAGDVLGGGRIDIPNDGVLGQFDIRRDSEDAVPFVFHVGSGGIFFQLSQTLVADLFYRGV